MAMVVEDGTGLENANSYVDLAFADAHFAGRGNEAWSDLDAAQKEVALIKATDYADARFTKRFVTLPLNNAQALLFPKTFYLDAFSRRCTGIPLVWKKAVCEYALIASKRELFTAAQTGAKEIKSKEVTVGPVTTKTSFADSPTVGEFTSYPNADKLVQSLFPNSTQVIR